MSWLSGLSIARKLGLSFIAILLLVACVVIANHWTDSAFTKAEEKGASDARADSAEEGLKHVEEGNKAAEGVARDAGLRKSSCVRHSRTPENC